MLSRSTFAGGVICLLLLAGNPSPLRAGFIPFEPVGPPISVSGPLEGDLSEGFDHGVPTGTQVKPVPPTSASGSSTVGNAFGHPIPPVSLTYGQGSGLQLGGSGIDIARTPVLGGGSGGGSSGSGGGGSTVFRPLLLVPIFPAAPPPPPVPPPPGPIGPGGGGNTTPEPTSVLLALTGLGILGYRRVNSR